MLSYFGTKESVYAPVAQLDRVTDYESVGRGFESLLAYQKNAVIVIPQLRRFQLYSPDGNLANDNLTNMRYDRRKGERNAAIDEKIERDNVGEATE